MITIMI